MASTRSLEGRLRSAAALITYIDLFKDIEEHFNRCLKKQWLTQSNHLTVTDVTALVNRLTDFIGKYGIEILKEHYKRATLDIKGEATTVIPLLAGLAMLTDNKELNRDNFFYFFKVHPNSIEPDKLLNELRSLYLRINNPDDRSAISKTCRNLRIYKTLKIPTISPAMPAESHARFFASTMQRDAKETALSEAIVQIYTLFSNPTQCTPFLRFLNSEFARYYQETHGSAFPSLSKKTYQLEYVDGEYYPFPTDPENYVGIKKEGALQKYLVTYLRQYGLGEHIYKWSGFVPKEMADNMIGRGDLAVEGLINTGLYHGKVTHLLQIALITCAVEHGDINLKYDDATLTMRDLLHTLVTSNASYDPDKSLWAKVLDGRVYNALRFSYPMTLNSWIMCRGRYDGFTELSNSLIDTFCKGAIKLLAAYKRLNIPLTQTQYIECVKDMSLNVFILPPSLIDTFKEKRREKELIAEGNSFFITEKRYDLNKTFVPTKFKEIPDHERILS